jgi:hypothetical protein
MPGSAFHATPLWLIQCIVSFVGKVKSRTLKLYLTGLKSHDVDLGLDTSGAEDTRVEGVLGGTKREHPHGQRREHAPGVHPKLIRILEAHPYLATQTVPVLRRVQHFEQLFASSSPLFFPFGKLPILSKTRCNRSLRTFPNVS